MPDKPWSDIRAVLFDLDGTLVHTRIDFGLLKTIALRHVEEAGLDPEAFRSLDILGVLAAASPQTEDPAAFLARAEADLAEHEEEASTGIVPVSGAVETLLWLRDRGIRVGIVTRNCPRAVARVLEQVPLFHEVLLTRADTPRVKPDPLHLLLALERLEAPASEAVMVGDHLMDVQGGRAAGMRTVGLLTEARPPDFFQHCSLGSAPDAVIRSLPELRRWISP